MLTHLTNLMTSWSTLPLAWLGRLTVTKMSILPKILYLFQVLPIPVPSHFLQILQRRVLKFIWGKTRPCIARGILYSSKLQGGLGLPHFTKYYQAAHLAQLPKYNALCKTSLCVALESGDCDPCLWPTYYGSAQLIASHYRILSLAIPYLCGTTSRLSFGSSPLTTHSYPTSETLPSIQAGSPPPPSINVLQPTLSELTSSRPPMPSNHFPPSVKHTDSLVPNFFKLNNSSPPVYT